MSPIDHPDVLSGRTHRVKLNCGWMYVTVNIHKGSPFEVFAVLGKGGACSHSNCEGIARLISRALQQGDVVAGLTKQLCGINCHAHGMVAGDGARSCCDAIGRVLKQYEEVKDVERNGHKDIP